MIMLETAAAALALSAAIVTTDHAVMRAAPRDSAQQQAQLWQGELLEVRGERLDYLQVWDHRRERGGFVRASQVRRTAMTAAEAPELLAVLGFVREAPGSESLGIGLAAAYLKAAPAEALRGEAGIEALDALGTLADRLAHRASWGATLNKTAQAAVAAQLEVAAHYGVNFRSTEREGRMQICYDGEALRRVLAMAAKPQQQARAALALTRPECVDPSLQPLQKAQVDQWRAEVLDRVDANALPGYLKNRVQMRRAAVWSTVAYQRARQGLPAEAVAQAAQRSLDALGGVSKAELPDADAMAYADAAMRVGANRWAALPAVASPVGPRPSITTVPGEPGETCVLLVDAKNGADKPLARRCTYALVWPQSAVPNREGNALALAVQPMEAWRELWLFTREAGGWTVSVLPPAASAPELGYAEFAGWVPGGKQVLVAREARAQDRHRRSFEVLRLATLAAERQAADPAVLGPFLRWQDAGWKRATVSLR
ncbi:MAG: hypothetical protein EOO25_07090 [Comamonadaceae bacterium]|nr:MAG: hypothetical protein EOO25_07090 [Comamonadaceae bacterium]